MKLTLVSKTLKDLRVLGYTVEVRHDRPLDSALFSKEELDNLHRGKMPSSQIERKLGFSQFGGETTVRILDPKKETEIYGDYVFGDDEPFWRKKGVAAALGRAMKGIVPTYISYQAKAPNDSLKRLLEKPAEEFGPDAPGLPMSHKQPTPETIMEQVGLKVSQSDGDTEEMPSRSNKAHRAPSISLKTSQMPPGVPIGVMDSLWFQKISKELREYVEVSDPDEVEIWVRPLVGRFSDRELELLECCGFNLDNEVASDARGGCKPIDLNRVARLRFVRSLHLVAGASPSDNGEVLNEDPKEILEDARVSLFESTRVPLFMGSEGKISMELYEHIRQHVPEDVTVIIQHTGGRSFDCFHNWQLKTIEDICFTWEQDKEGLEVNVTMEQLQRLADLPFIKVIILAYDQQEEAATRAITRQEWEESE